MNLSANSLYHFTSEYRKIESILTNGFRYSILKEDVPFSSYAKSPFSIQGIIKYINTSKAICFCDIPLELCKKHREQYGNYVIGLFKEWGIGKGITPIRYIHYYSPDINHDSYRMMRDSFMMYQQHHYFPFDFYLKVLKDLGKIEQPSEEEINNLPKFASEAIILMSSQLMDMAQYILFSQNYLRTYEGDWEDRVTKQITKRRYYDEREWRAIKTDEDNINLIFNLAAISDIIVNTVEEKEKISSFVCDLYKVKDKQEIESKIKLWENIPII